MLRAGNERSKQTVSRRKRQRYSGEGRDRTGDTGLFRAVLYQLSYLTCGHPETSDKPAIVNFSLGGVNRCSAFDALRH